jgi:hypothetical protein
MRVSKYDDTELMVQDKQSWHGFQNVILWALPGEVMNEVFGNVKV